MRYYKPRKDYKGSYQRFLHTQAWAQTKVLALDRWKKRWKKMKLNIPEGMFYCGICKKIMYLKYANYHHIRYKNKWLGNLDWANPKNVIIICYNCHKGVHKK